MIAACVEYVVHFDFIASFFLPPRPSQTKVVVVQQQAAQPSVIVTHETYADDHYYTLSLILVFVSACCGLAFLVCTLPAFFLASIVS